MRKSIDTGVAPMRHARFIWYGSEALEAPRPAAGAKTRGGRKEALPPKNGRCVHFSSMPVVSYWSINTLKIVENLILKKSLFIITYKLLIFTNLIKYRVSDKSWSIGEEMIRIANYGVYLREWF